MTQNQEEIENNFHGKRVMYGGLALLDHSLLQPFNMRYRIFCCTRPRTGSRDSHTVLRTIRTILEIFVANLKITVGVNPLVSN